MKKQFKKIGSLVLAFAMVLTTMITVNPLPAQAASTTVISDHMTSAYKKGTFGQKTCGLKLSTTNPRQNFVDVVTQQVNYRECPKDDSKLSGETSNGDTNYTEYGKWAGAQGLSWCQSFISWCGYTSKNSQYIRKGTVTRTELKHFEDIGCGIYSNTEIKDGKYTPKAGDIIYMKGSTNYTVTLKRGTFVISHVGMVTSYANGTIHYIDGNSGNQVCDTNTKSVNSSSAWFVVNPFKDEAPVPDKVVIKMNSYPKKDIPENTAVSLSGTITAKYKLKTVKAYVDGTNLTKTVSPTTSSYTIGNEVIDNSLKFGTLKPGKYVFYVVATDINGKKDTFKSSFTITAKGPTPTNKMVTLQNGSKGYQVKALQYMLNYYGAGIDVDGIYGTATTTAVKNFQSSHNLTVTGKVTDATWNKLMVQQSVNKYSKNMTKAVQTLLNGRSNAGLTVDGVYGSGTKTAVSNYQRSHGLDVDGICGTKTWTSLLAK